MFSPEMVTLPVAMLKMRKSSVPDAALRWTLNRFAPGPVIVRFLLINNSALVSVIVIRPAEKLIVSPLAAVAIACRSVQLAPGQVPPASAALFTISVAARPPDALHASAAKQANRIRRLIFTSPRRDENISHSILRQ